MSWLRTTYIGRCEGRRRSEKTGGDKWEGYSIETSALMRKEIPRMSFVHGLVEKNGHTLARLNQKSINI